MDSIKELLNQDYSSMILSIFVVIFGIVSIFTIVEKFSIIIGKPVKWLKSRNSDHELLLKTIQDLSGLCNKQEEDTKQSIRHDEMIRNDLLKLTDTVNGIAATLDNMQKKNNETKLKELKDNLITYYNKYKTIGEWSKLEKDAFWDLFEDYESRGGDGYIHSIVEPVMRELKEIE